MYKYFLHIIIGIDQLITTIFGGWPDETISSYVYRLREQKKFFGFFANWIDSFFKLVFKQENHCYKAYLEERDRIQFPLELR